MMDKDFKKLHIKELKEKLGSKSVIGIEDFYIFYKGIYNEIKRSTVRWYVYKLKEGKIIRNVSRGIYVLESQDNRYTNEYAVITIDIIESSKMTYLDFNNDLKNKVRYLNEAISSRLNYDRAYYISQGDEIQILCPIDDRLGKLFAITLSSLRPYKFRYAISFGIVKEKLEENSWNMNGPIFWNARDKMNLLKKSKEYKGILVSEFNYLDSICNKFLAIINIQIERISEKQWEAILLYLIKEDVNEIMEDMRISKTSFYDRISTSNVEEIIDSFDAIVELMKKRRELG